MHTPHFITSFFKRFGRTSHLDPSRDWMVMLTIAGILFAGIVVWHAWIFDTVARGGSIGSSATTPPSVFSASSLDAIQTIFTNRSTEEAKYATGVYRYTDPSQ